MQLIRDFKPDLIMVTPSYMLAIIDEFPRQGLDPGTHSESLEWLAELGLPTHRLQRIAKTPDDRELIAACLPEILVKGGDYSAASTAGAAEVIAAGGRFESIPFAFDRSTTDLVRRIRR